MAGFLETMGLGSVLQVIWQEVSTCMPTTEATLVHNVLLYYRVVPDMLILVSTNHVYIVNCNGCQYQQTIMLWLAGISVNHNVSSSRISVLPDHVSNRYKCIKY